jgi:hypothetical protein
LNHLYGEQLGKYNYLNIFAAIPNLGIKKGVGLCLARMSGQQQGAGAKPPWMGLRRSSIGIPHTLKSAKLLKLGIADIFVCFVDKMHFIG